MWQQLLFDVDWRNDGEGPRLDVLVANMLPGTRDVQLTLGQLVVANGTCADPRCWYVLIQSGSSGAVIISTPQDVACQVYPRRSLRTGA